MKALLFLLLSASVAGAQPIIPTPSPTPAGPTTTPVYVPNFGLPTASPTPTATPQPGSTDWCLGENTGYRWEMDEETRELRCRPCNTGDPYDCPTWVDEYEAAQGDGE